MELIDMEDGCIVLGCVFMSLNSKLCSTFLLNTQ